MTRTYTVKCTVQISTQNTAQSFTASLAKWLSVRLRTKGSGFESSCSHLILGVETKHYGYLLASIILEKLHLSKIKLLIDVKIRSSHRQMFCREGVLFFEVLLDLKMVNIFCMYKTTSIFQDFRT